MKKIIFLAIAASLMTVSCSRDEREGIINRSNEINFRASFDKTRAVVTNTTNLGSIYVTAISTDASGNETGNYFTDVEFTHTIDGESDYHYDSNPKYYWPANTLHFFAYSPNIDSAGTHIQPSITATSKTLTYIPDRVISNQVDVVVAKAEGNSTEKDYGTKLDFNHILSQIEIKAKNENSNYVINVKGVRIGRAVSKGTYDFSTNSWTRGSNPADPADTTDYTIRYAEARTLISDAISLMDISTHNPENAMLIPQPLTEWDRIGDSANANHGAFLSVWVNIQSGTTPPTQIYPTEGNYDWAAIPIGTEWNAGEEYLYTLDFSHGAGYAAPDTTHIDFKPGDPILGGESGGNIVIYVGNDSIVMVHVKGDTFKMGKDATDKDDYNPAHNVTLSDYWIGKYEVTQGLWKAVMGDNNPSLNKAGDNYPVDNVSWDDICKPDGFLDKLNDSTESQRGDRIFKLPTEAQWEFAARGGIHRRDNSDGSPYYPYAGDDDITKVGWYMKNSNGKTQIVGTLNPNELSIYDMSGNVWEWCSDYYDKDYYQTCYNNNTVTDPKGPDKDSDSRSAHIHRGGCQSDSERSKECWECWVIDREKENPNSHGIYCGFRLVLVPSTNSSEERSYFVLSGGRL